MKRKSILSILFVTAIVVCLIYIDQTSAQKGNRKAERASTSPAALTSAFTPGNLVVYRVDGGGAALSSVGTAVFLDEYTTAAGQTAPVQSIAMPTAVSGSNKRLVAAGSSTSEGLMTRSVDGNYLVLAGYDADVGTAAVAATTSAATNRVIGRIDKNGAIDTTTALTDAISGGNPRGATSTNGTDLWLSGTSSGGGIRYATLGATTSTSLTTSPTNFRATNIFSGQLYTTSASGAFQGVSTVGTGTPTTSGQTTTILPGFPTASGPSPYQFVFFNSTIIYVCDDRAVASGGGIQKWTFSSGTWTLVNTLNNGLTAGCHGLTFTTNGSGQAVLYATTADALTKLVSVTDDGTASPGAAFTTLATAAANTAFRSVAFAPGAAVVHVQHVLDFNGDGKTDFCVVRNSGGAAASQLRWFYNINGSSAATAAFDFGLNTDVLVPADYDGDSKTDIAVWRGDSSPAFYILQSKTNTVRIEPFGLVGDDPTVVADYNGDGSADVAVYRPGVGAGAQSFWFYRTVSGGPIFYVPWGTTGDTPAPGNYDTDAKADFGIVRTEGLNLRWWTLTAAGVSDSSTLFGLSTDKVVTGDFDGDGITDKAVVRSSGGSLIWYLKRSTDSGNAQLTFGLTGDTLAPGDYDGDGFTDLAVWRNGLFYVFSPVNSTVNYFQLGAAGDRVPASYNTHSHP